MEGRISFSELQKRIGFKFSNENLLLKALTHKSYSYEKGTECNERLEFLGDSLLNFIVSDYLFKNFPELKEGDMSKLKARLVGMETLYKIGRRIGVGEALLLGKGEEKTAGREKKRLVGSTVEAIIASIYLDSGYENAKETVIRWIKPFLRTVKKGLELSNDFKSLLQEFVQKKKLGLPEYRVADESGPPHKKRFKIEIWIENKRISSSTGSSKKEAQQKAAKIALKRLSNQLA